MATLKNINFMSQSRFNGLSSVSQDELYAVEYSIMPNYSAGVSKTTSANTAWTAPSDGWVSVWKQVPNTSTNYYVYVNNQVVGYGISIEAQSGLSTVFPVSKGDSIKYNINVNSAIFYPCKGA